MKKLSIFLTVALISVFIQVPQANALTANFTTPGSTTWDVPAGVTSITVDAQGAAGVAGTFGGAGGAGGRVQTTLTTTPGETLTISVGQIGGGSSGGGGDANGRAGGGGGSQTSVTRGGSLVVIAGGGGGGGGGFTTGSNSCAVGGAGGQNGTTGSNGCNNGNSSGTGGGGGVGGSGGSAGLFIGCCGQNGGAGSSNQGGNGGNGTGFGGGTGGGGGGRGYGGGGGGGSGNNFAGGGGGGSSLAGTGTSSTTFTSGANSADGQTVFTYTPGNTAVVSTAPATSITPFTVTINGRTNPNSIASTTGWLRYSSSNPGSCGDAFGTRAPASSANDTALGGGSSDVAFFQNITGLTPGTVYYFCSISNNAQGKVYGSVHSFTAAGTSSCSAAISGNFMAGSSCTFSNTTIDGVDNGTGTTNTAQITLSTGQSLSVGPGQTVGFGVINKVGASIVKFSGGMLKKGPIWIPDTDGDGYPDAANANGQIFSFTQPAGYTRRFNAVALGLDYAPNDPLMGGAMPSGIIVGWPSTNASIPSGWTRVTSMDSTYPKGTAAGVGPNVTGGEATHAHTSSSHTHTIASHTHTTTVAATTAISSTNCCGVQVAIGTHSHTGTTTGAASANIDATTPTWVATASDPAYYGVIWIQSNGTSAGLPAGAWAFGTSGSLPTNWTQPAAARSNFLKGVATSGDGGTTGGGAHSHADTHTHTVASHAHAGSTSGGASNFNDNANNSAQSGPPVNHTHVISATSDTTGAGATGSLPSNGSTTYEPPYKVLSVLQASVAVLGNNIAALWLGSLASIPSGWQLCDGTNSTPDMRGLFVKAASLLSEVGNTGGTLGHTHTDPSAHTHSVSHAHTGSNGTASANTSASAAGGGQATFTSMAHTHPITVSTDTQTSSSGTTTVNSNSDTQPPFRTVAYICR